MNVCLEKMKVLAYFKGSKRDWDLSKIIIPMYDQIRIYFYIYISKGVFPELGMQLFSLCHGARMYGANFPHSKMISHSVWSYCLPVGK